MKRDQHLLKAKYKYILFDGMLGWGLTVGFLLVGYRHFINHERIGWIDFIGSIFTFLICGIFYGWIMWKFVQWREKNTRDYR